MGDGVVVSARYRKDEQPLVQLARRRVVPRRALEIVTTVSNSAALRFVPFRDLHAEVQGACRNLRSQAAKSEGAKR